MTEDTLPTFETFCQYHDVATLAADQDHIGRYEEIVQLYAHMASIYPSVQPKGILSAPVAIRWRSVGLRALRSVTSSEAMGADGGKQLSFVMPVILQNLHPESEDYLATLQNRILSSESADKEMTRRRMSIATVRTSKTSAEADSTPVVATDDDADRVAEEEVALQALKSLKQIFVTNNRAQIRTGASCMLRFICAEVPYLSKNGGKEAKSGPGSWATALMELVANWAPVQDRFVILVTIIETLIRNPITEENLEQQLVLITLVGWLLRSSINMVGLSVMDVLLGLIQHILLLLQLGGKGSNVLPHHQQTDAINLFQDTENIMSLPLSLKGAEKATAENEVTSPSINRQELLSRLQKCIGDLATHIYYSDQIPDIITAILLRLKPSPLSGVNSDTAAIENPNGAARAISTSINLQENPDTDDFFSFGTARITALQAIKEVLTVANLKAPVGAGAIGRNRVGVQVWEGTQWLLRDTDRRVRRAYTDALLTWLKLEMSKNDLRVMEDKREALIVSSKPKGESNGWGQLTRRAVSNASQREKSGKPVKSTFLDLLHLAIYDNAIESPDSEADILLLHLLMVSLVEKLGVNAAKTGLPMIRRLQEDINIDEIIPTPTAKLNVGSLVHGYLWALSEKFDLDSTKVGYEIHTEITRRQKDGLWLDGIRLPPIPLDQIITASTLLKKPPLSVLQIGSLKPFDSNSSMVCQIATSYASSVASPPTSPLSSPGRDFSMPVISDAEPSPSKNDLPSEIRESMLAEWSKDICIASIEKESARTVSLNGSRNGANFSIRQKYLGVSNRSTRNGSPTGAHSPVPASDTNHNSNNVLQTNALTSALQDPQEHHFKRSSTHNSGSPTPMSSSDQNQTLRVDDLKRVLAEGKLDGKIRGASPLRNSTTRRDFAKLPGDKSSSTGSESVVSVDSFESTSERDVPRAILFAPPSPLVKANKANIINDAITARPRSSGSRPHSISSRPQSQHGMDSSRANARTTIRPSSSSSSANEDPTANAKALRGDLVASLPTTASEMEDDDVPPVPPLPTTVALQKHIAVIGGQIDPRPDTFTDGEKGSLPRHAKKNRGVDVNALLGSIDPIAGDNRIVVGRGKPPY